LPAPPIVDNHDGGVVAHWIPAFAGMTSAEVEERPTEAGDAPQLGGKANST